MRHNKRHSSPSAAAPTSTRRLFSKRLLAKNAVDQSAAVGQGDATKAWMEPWRECGTRHGVRQRWASSQALAGSCRFDRPTPHTVFRTRPSQRCGTRVAPTGVVSARYTIRMVADDLV